MMNDSGSNSTLVDLLKPLIRGASTDSYNVKKWQKTYLDVLGVCCSSEVVLVEKLLKPLEGVQKVTVIVPSRTVIIVHDPVAVPQSHIVKTLNKAGLEASVRAYGTSKIINKWPSSYILACGFLLLMSLFEWFFHPLHWLALAAACVGLPPMLLRGFTAACRLTLDINILMLVAVGGAIALNDYLEAGTIVFLFTTAEWLETLACRKASAGMSSLMSMIPQKAVLAETGEVVDVDDVHIDTVIAIRAGEVVPIDGVVVNGQSEVDERSLTGESFPVSKQAQSQVWAGTLNIDGYITVRTTAMAENSSAAKMARLVEEAQNSRSKTQRLIDSCVKYYTPAVVVLAAGVALVPLVVRAHNLKHWFELALVLLVSACPCALVLSTPVATFCALLRAARMGLLIKGGDILESLAEIKVAAFDKTGTITKGDFSIEAFHVIGQKVEISNLLYWVSCIESKSSHPMASALVNYAQSKSIQPKPDNVAEFHIYPGEGIYGEIDRNHIYIGNKRIMTRASSQTPPEMKDLRGVSVGYVFCNKELVGVFLLSDDCRTGSKEAIMELKSLGIKSVMLTGDSTAAAAHAQNQLGGVLDELHSELLPEDKVHIIGDLRMRAGPTLMVGDGMNDAPALAKADVGVSMGISGSAVAMETSHVTLMSSDILRIPKVIRLGKRTHWTILANIIFSLGAKVGVLVFALAGHPLIWAAVLADVGTCLLVILNSMLLLRERKSTREEKCRASVKSLAMRSQLTGSNTACESSKDNNYNIWIKDEGNNFHCCQEQTKKEHSVVIDMPPEPTVHTKAKNKIGGCCDNNIVVGGASQKCHACEREKSSGKEKCTSGQGACCKQQRTEFGSSHATAEDCKNVGCFCGREEHGRASVAMVNKDLCGCCKNFENEVGTKEILEDYGNTKCSASGTQEFVKENCCSGARKALMEGEIGGCCKNRNKEIAEVNLKDCRKVKSVVRVEARNLGGKRMVDTLLGQKKTPTRPDLVWELM